MSFCGDIRQALAVVQDSACSDIKSQKVQRANDTYVVMIRTRPTSRNGLVTDMTMTSVLSLMRVGCNSLPRWRDLYKIYWLWFKFMQPPSAFVRDCIPVYQIVSVMRSDHRLFVILPFCQVLYFCFKATDYWGSLICSYLYRWTYYNLSKNHQAKSCILDSYHHAGCKVCGGPASSRSHCKADRVSRSGLSWTWRALKWMLSDYEADDVLFKLHPEVHAV